MNYFAGFDIETFVLPQEGQDWSEEPLGISCAAIHVFGRGEPLLFYDTVSFDGEANRMSKDQCSWMLDVLIDLNRHGHRIVTWNGNFDWRVLGIESGRLDECRIMAHKNYDPMYQFYCIKGFPVGLQAASMGMKLEGKTEGMHGDLAPEMWVRGLDERKKVLEYVAQDARATTEIALAIMQEGRLQWVSKASGRTQSVLIPKLVSVDECSKINAPDTSWMKQPIPRSEFYNW